MDSSDPISGRSFASVLKKGSHRHFIFSIPKILRRYFLYDRKLLHDLSRCAWESLKVFLQEVIIDREGVKGTKQFANRAPGWQVRKRRCPRGLAAFSFVLLLIPTQYVV